MPAILTLGERTIDAEGRLETLREKEAQQVAERDEAVEAESELSGRLEAEYRKIQDAVVTELSPARGLYQSRSSYSIGVVRSRFDELSPQLQCLEDHELSSKISLVGSENRESLAEIAVVEFIDSGFAGRSHAALNASPVTSVLDTLESNPEASSWVEEGRHFHSDAEQCLYCGGILSADRRRSIEEHFSTEVSDQQRRLDELIRALADAKELANAQRQLPDPGLTFEDLRSDLAAAVASIGDQASNFLLWASTIESRLRAKRENVLAEVSAQIDDPPVLDPSDFNRIVEAHNERVSNHADQVQEAARSVELHLHSIARSEIDQLSASLRDQNVRLEAVLESLAETQEEIARLENVDGDPAPSAHALSVEVEQLLGRGELTFRSHDGRYLVERNGRPAVDLSSGERTAVALVHFLESVSRSASVENGAIVVVDDPVSSLDSGIFFGASSMLWNRAAVNDGVAQIILLTHSFELFREWDIQSETLHRNRRRQTNYPAAFFELKSRNQTRAGVTTRCPSLEPWPATEAIRKKSRSSYHHAILMMADAKISLDADDSLERKLDAQLLFPNIIRRTLEAFLAFKRPELIGRFDESMRQSAELLSSGGYEGDADALRLRLTRYAHAFSHSDSQPTDSVVAPDEVGPALTSVFDFINLVDRAHFEGLCAALGLDPTRLTSTPQEDGEADEPDGSIEVHPDDTIGR